MRAWCGAALMAAGLAAPTGAAAENRALLVGVGDYRHGDVTDLPGVDLDIKMMRDVAAALGFAPSQIRTLEDGTATLESIRAAFDEWLIGGAGPDDRVLFYFSGHGAYVPDTDGDETDDQRDEVLLPHDTTVAAGTGLGNVLTDDVLGQWLAKLRAGVSYVLVDACHSGSVTKGIRAPGATVVKYVENPVVVKRAPCRPGATACEPPRPRDSSFVDISVTRSGAARYIALAAAADNEQSLASRQGSYFTIGVLKAVQGGAGSRSLTMRTVQQESAKEIARLADASRVHHPQLGGDISLADDNLFAARAPAPASSVWADLEAIVDAAPTPLSIAQVQPAYTTKDRMTIEIALPRGGYLNVITVSEATGAPTVLFPNRLAPENQVPGGGTVRIPAAGARYQLSFALPEGVSEERNLLVAFLTDEPLNAHQNGSGPAVFRELSSQGIRSTRGAVVSDAGYAAGKVVYVLR